MRDDTLLRVVRELEAFVDGRRDYCTWGLCTEVTIATGCDIAWLVRVAAYSWQHFSGDSTYPVPGGEAEYNLHVRDAKYRGAQGEYRKSLAAHLLTYIWFNPQEAAALLGSP